MSNAYATSWVVGKIREYASHMKMKHLNKQSAFYMLNK